MENGKRLVAYISSTMNNVWILGAIFISKLNFVFEYPPCRNLSSLIAVYYCISKATKLAWQIISFWRSYMLKTIICHKTFIKKYCKVCFAWASKQCKEHSQRYTLGWMKMCPPPPYPDIFQIKDIEFDRYLKKMPYNSSILLKIYHLSLFFLYEIAWYE